MPNYQYLLDDVGKNSNDHYSKILLNKMHGVEGEVEDPRDWQKPYMPKVAEKHVQYLKKNHYP